MKYTKNDDLIAGNDIGNSIVSIKKDADIASVSLVFVARFRELKELLSLLIDTGNY